MSNKPNTSRWTLRKYLDDVYIPEKKQGKGLTDRTILFYRQAVNLLDRFHGAPILCCEVNDELLEKFVMSMVKRGLTFKTARSRAHNIKGIVRHWNPERFPLSLEHVGKPWFPEADDKSTLDHVFFKLYLPERMTITTDSTIAQYARALRLFGEFLGRPAKGEHLRDNTVGQFMRWLIDVQGVKATTANGYSKQIRALWNWMAKKRLVKLFPTISKMPEPECTPTAWSKSDVGKLFRACRESTGCIRGIPASDYWTAFHYILWDTGERTGAMLELRWEWVDLKTGHLSVPGEYRKGRKQSMIYRLKPETVNALKAILLPEREVIFDVAKWRNHFHTAYRLLVKRAGLPYVRGKCGPQKMRRTFASFIEAAGGNATKALRHRDRRVTEDSYLDPRITDVESENLKLFPPEGTDAA